jgi:hypothetical protein
VELSGVRPGTASLRDVAAAYLHEKEGRLSSNRIRSLRTTYAGSWPRMDRMSLWQIIGPKLSAGRRCGIRIRKGYLDFSPMPQAARDALEVYLARVLEMA